MEKANIVHTEALKKLDETENQEIIGTTSHKLSIYSRSFKMLQTCIYNISFYLETIAVIDAD